MALDGGPTLTTSGLINSKMKGESKIPILPWELLDQVKHCHFSEERLRNTRCWDEKHGTRSDHGYLVNID